MCEGAGRGKTTLQVFFSESLRLMLEYELFSALILNHRSYGRVC